MSTPLSYPLSNHCFSIFSNLINQRNLTFWAYMTSAQRKNKLIQQLKQCLNCVAGATGCYERCMWAWNLKRSEKNTHICFNLITRANYSGNSCKINSFVKLFCYALLHYFHLSTGRSSSAMNAIRSGMKMWSDNTCITFRERRGNDRSYAYFQGGGG